MSNLIYWNQLKITDPRHTTKITGKGYKAKSVDPAYQLEKMTTVFGPCGQGWGYETETETEHLPGNTVMAVVAVRLWYIADDERCEFGPVTSACILATQMKDDDRNPAYDKNCAPRMRFDDDAFKKAETDALTKAMSRLGMSADVFAGLHDDNKYVSFMEGITGKEAAQRLLTAARGAVTKPQRDAIRQIANQNLAEEAIDQATYEQALAILTSDTAAETDSDE